jgi:hypothetical protein
MWLETPGEVLCIFGNRPSIPMCGEGTVSLSGGSSGLMECIDPQIGLLYRQADELGMALAPRPSSLAPSCKPA